MPIDNVARVAPIDELRKSGTRSATVTGANVSSPAIHLSADSASGVIAKIIARVAPAKPDSGARSGRASRLLDRHVGRALIRVAGVTRKTVRVPDNPARIAVSVLGAIGDALIAGALAQDLKDAFPNAEIVFVVTATNRHIVPLLPAVHGVLEIPPSRPDIAIRLIRQSRFDVFVDCNQWLRISALHAVFAGCFTVGFRTPGQHRHHAYDKVVDHLATRHELQNFRALLEPLGVVPHAVPDVIISDEAHSAVSSLLRVDGDRQRRRNIVVFHPWASGMSAWLKEWPTESWVALAAAVAERGYEVFVTGAKGDAPKVDLMVAAAAKRNVEIRSTAGSLSLSEVAALLAAAKVVVSVNTGVMHLAAAVGSPLVALHGPTNPDRWGPLSERAAIVVPEGVPSGYLHLGFEYPKDARECMPAISVAAVLDAVLRMLDCKPAAYEQSPLQVSRGTLVAGNV